jgi:hypothetical protein
MELLKNKAVIAGLVLLVGLIYLIATGNMGGAKKATGNYVKVRQSGGSSSDIEARPNPMQQMIEYNKQQKNK